jgi:hypothetical protein
VHTPLAAHTLVVRPSARKYPWQRPANGCADIADGGALALVGAASYQGFAKVGRIMVHAALGAPFVWAALLIIFTTSLLLALERLRGRRR